MIKIKNKQGKVLLEYRGDNLVGADLSWIDLAGAELRWTELQGANLAGANLRDADLEWTKLIEANLRGADLSGADMREARLWGANLVGADLTRVDLTQADLWRADITDANMTDAYLAGADFNGALYTKDRPPIGLPDKIMKQLTVKTWKNKLPDWIADFLRPDVIFVAVWVFVLLPMACVETVRNAKYYDKIVLEQTTEDSESLVKCYKNGVFTDECAEIISKREIYGEDYWKEMDSFYKRYANDQN